VEPLQRHAGPLQLLVEPGHVGQRPRHADEIPHPPEQPGFELGVVPLGRQWPRQVCHAGPPTVLGHRGHAHAAGTGNGPVGQVLLVLQSKNFADLPHRYPLRHLSGRPPFGGSPYRGDQAADERSGSESAIGIPGTGDHDAPLSAIRLDRNERSGSVGTGDQDEPEPSVAHVAERIDRDQCANRGVGA
jgi:hypothetical protein